MIVINKQQLIIIKNNQFTITKIFIYHLKKSHIPTKLQEITVQIILLKLLKQLFLFIQFTFFFSMTLAALITPIAHYAFLVQYYLLIAIIFFKKVILKLTGHPQSNSDDFSYHPLSCVHPDVFIHSHQLIGHKELTFQIYQCRTQDNAYVSLWRMRHSQPQKWNQQNPILIQHGLLDCSMSWFLHEQKQKNLPILLALQGYDVWIGNNRGTIFSDKNSHLPNYWDFNIDHFAKYDQPALINKVLQETGKSKLIYIGHSQGSTQFLLGQGQNQYLQSKIQKFFGMGTVISLQNLKDHGLLKILSKFYIIEILQKIGFKAILTIPRWMNRKVGVLIHHYQFYVTIIIGFIYFLCGKTQKNNINPKRLGIMVSHQPGGTSVHSVKHWIQAFRNGKFRKYDYGKKKNLEIHGTEIPPQYTFSHIKQLPYKSHIFRGQCDAVMSDKDFQTLIGHFSKNNLEVHLLKDYAHLDYAWSISAKQDIYDKILDILKNQKQTPRCSRSMSYETTQDGSFSSSQFLIDFET